MKEIIETTSLRVIACDVTILQTAIEGNEKLATLLGVEVPDNWTEFGNAALQYSLNKLSQSEEEKGWATHFPIHKAHNKLIGSGGYKGKPTEDGFVEIGYEIAANYRGKGLATELAQALVSNAFMHKQVSCVVAHTLGEENASTKILSKIGFVKTAEINDPEDGLIWKWELKR